MKFEKGGVPCAIVLTSDFASLGRQAARSFGMPTLPIITIPHPMDRYTRSEVRSIADKVLDDIVGAITGGGRLSSEGVGPSPAQENVIVPLFDPDERIPDGPVDMVNDLFYERGWTDGLPIIPPTEERVERMLKGTPRAPEDSLGILPPRGTRATVEKIAVNAVMAGCLPGYLPVVIAAVEAMAEERFNLGGVVATTNPASPLVIINGPIRERLKVNCGYGLFGSGWRANASIGRAVRLVITNIAGGTPAIADRSTFGQAGKYSFCIGENQEASPWDPLHVERGHPAEASTVTLFGGTHPQNIIDFASTSAIGILQTLAAGVSSAGNNNIIGRGEPLIILSPEIAANLAKGGFDKGAIKRFIYENARAPLSSVPDLMNYRARTRSFFRQEEETLSMFRIADGPEDIMILVAGGAAGPHISFVNSFFNQTRSVTRIIE